MKFFLLKMMIFVSSILPYMKTPLSMGTMVMLQTILSTILMNSMMMDSWFPMITLLMMVEGMMVLFMYMSSVASNEKFKMNLNLSLIMIFLLFPMEEMLVELQINETQSIMMTENQEVISMVKLYNKKSMSMTMFLVLILLLTMISISKIVILHSGPLRSKTYE